jgi:hypothetical protein
LPETAGRFAAAIAERHAKTKHQVPVCSGFKNPQFISSTKQTSV